MVASRNTPSRQTRQSPKHLSLLNKKLNQLGEQYRQLVAKADYAAALKVTIQAQSLVPGNPQVLGDTALCQLRLGQWESAYALYKRVCHVLPGDPNLWDGLTEVCGHLGRHDEVRTYGCNALAIKDQQAIAKATETLLALPAIPAMSADPKRNIIAFSLFGNNPRYCESARLNIRQARLLLPNWTCRFYLDESVPEAVRNALQEDGAEVILVSHDDQKDISGLMWRFLVLQDHSIDRYLLRDADSLISTREAAAVNEWVSSDKHFHLMRDCFSHTELLLAGMWGGCSGIFKNTRNDMINFARQGKYLGQRVIDQHFLRHTVWPVARQSLLAHDAVFGYLESKDFPVHPPHQMGEEFHVGANMGAYKIEGQTALPDGAQVKWQISNTKNQIVCEYISTVLHGRWSANVPKIYADHIASGTWRVLVTH